MLPFGLQSIIFCKGKGKFNIFQIIFAYWEVEVKWPFALQSVAFCKDQEKNT